MSVPTNAQDLKRLKALVEIFEQENVGEIHIYVGESSSVPKYKDKTFVSLEIRGYIASGPVKDIFK